MIKALTISLALAGVSLSAVAQDAKAGEKLAAMCIGCHGIVGYQASFPEVHRVPMISGQNAKYIVASLVAYQKGERKHPTMKGIAGSLTEQQMADLGAYYEQHGRSSVVSVAQTAKAPSAEVKALLDKGACASCHGVDYNKPIDGAYPKLAGQQPDRPHRNPSADTAFELPRGSRHHEIQGFRPIRRHRRPDVGRQCGHHPETPAAGQR